LVFGVPAPGLVAWLGSGTIDTEESIGFFCIPWDGLSPGGGTREAGAGSETV